MDEEIEIDKSELLNQREEEIVNGDSYIQVKITMLPIPTKKLKQIGKEYAKLGKQVLGNFIEMVEDFVDENIEYSPIFSVNGKNVSEADKLIVLALAKTMCENDVFETALGINFKNKERGEEND